VPALSLAYHKRSLPLAWHVEPGSKGHTTEDLQIELIKRLHTHFQPDKPVIFLKVVFVSILLA